MHRDEGKGASIMAFIMFDNPGKTYTRWFRSLDRHYTRHALTLRRRVARKVKAYWTFPWECAFAVTA